MTRKKRTLVLGWDGLDYELADDFVLSSRFGVNNRRLATYENPVIGKPHTYEVWPSIITGRRPGDPDDGGHGINAEEYTHGHAWSNPLLGWAAKLSRYTVPSELRWRVGRVIRGRGATFDFKTYDHYVDNDIWTIFDDRSWYGLGIPNCRSQVDDDLDIQVDRGAHLAEYMDIETGPDGETIHQPNVNLSTFSARLGGDAAFKLWAARHAMDFGYDMMFVWLGYLDTVGHVAPTVDDPDRWMEDAYRRAASITQHLRSDTPDDVRIICVSDHGLRDGKHTKDAYIGATSDLDLSDVHSVTDVGPWLDGITTSGNAVSPPYRPAESAEDFARVEGRLKNLGYVE